jgi:hypothetical protein
MADKNITWVTLLRSEPSAWNAFKAFLEERRDSVKARLVDCPLDQIVELRGRAKELSDIEAMVTGEEREQNARTARRTRESSEPTEFRLKWGDGGVG